MTEIELCDRFMEIAQKDNWTCYPETSGWDLLLVRDTTQIGIQAKLRANLKVVHQCLPDLQFHPRRLDVPRSRKKTRIGPNYRAVLIPGEKTANKTLRILCHICGSLGLWVFTDRGLGWALLKDGSVWPYQYDWEPEQQEWLPAVIPHVDAGSASPVRLTKWKQKALRLLARAQVRGQVTSRDAKEIGIDFSRFIDRSRDPWLAFQGKQGRRHAYALIPAETLRPDSKRPDRQHPQAFVYFLKEAEKEKDNEH